MLTITNGTISRTYKPGDYESRMVSLSFNCDPGDDLDVGLANLSALAEKHARQMPVNPVQGKKRLTGDELVGNAHPPTPASTEAASLPASASADKRADPPTPSSVSATDSAPVTAAQTAALTGTPTADDVVAAAQAAVKRIGADKRHEVTAVVNKFVDEPNMPIRSTPEAKRAALIADLAKLGALIGDLAKLGGGSDY